MLLFQKHYVLQKAGFLSNNYFLIKACTFSGLPRCHSGKESACQCRRHRYHLCLKKWIQLSDTQVILHFKQTNHLSTWFNTKEWTDLFRPGFSSDALPCLLPPASVLLTFCGLSSHSYWPNCSALVKWTQRSLPVVSGELGPKGRHKWRKPPLKDLRGRDVCLHQSPCHLWSSA